MGAVAETKIVESTDDEIYELVSDMILSARYDYGNAGYTGTIAEADGVSIELYHEETEENIHNHSSIVDKYAEKWGPAVVIRVKDKPNHYAILGIYSD